MDGLDARTLIARLELAPHPEGGWFRETWRAPCGAGERAASTAILFLLEAHQRSHWHRVDADEIWLWHGGDPLRLSTAPHEASPVASTILGSGLSSGHALQHVVPAGHWQAADPAPGGRAGYALVSCMVAPGFDFAGFTLAEPGWAPGRK
ncbi:MAG: cupin domain-containing protein [Novosphingobium sp.]|nr:cupin domain-containing protein [Novosphingobium sp.]